MSGAPTDVNGQIEALMLAIADRARFIGQATPPENREIWVARAYLPSDSHFGSLVDELLNRKWLTSGGDRNGTYYRLFLEGWEKIRTFRRSSADGNLAFVAMWFHRDMD